MMRLQNIKTLWVRSMLFLLVWWVLTTGNTPSLKVGIPAALTAGLISVLLLPTIRFSLWAWIRFLPFFLLHSVRGGIDIAMRVFRPSLPISPGVLEYPTQLDEGLPRMTMISVITLLPGTLSVDLEHNVLKIHVLNTQSDVMSELRSIERHIAKIFCSLIMQEE